MRDPKAVKRVFKAIASELLAIWAIEFWFLEVFGEEKKLTFYMKIWRRMNHVEVVNCMNERERNQTVWNVRQLDFLSYACVSLTYVIVIYPLLLTLSYIGGVPFLYVRVFKLFWKQNVITAIVFRPPTNNGNVAGFVII